MRPIEAIRIGKRHRRDLGDVKGLAQSISELGLLHPVVITPDDELIAGQRRLEACRLLGWEEVPVYIVDLADFVRGEADENVKRKDFLPSEAVEIARVLEPVEREETRKRQDEVKRQARNQVDDNEVGNLPVSLSSSNGRVRDKIASYVGMSGRTLEKAQQIVEAAEQEPEKYMPLVEQMDKTERINGVYKKFKRMQQAEEIEQEPPPLPDGPFRIIVVDPPWAYDNRADDPAHRAANPYPSMSPGEIKTMPIGDLAEDDSILWLWTTNAHLPIAFEVVKAWGFEYKTMLTWVKDRMGTGDWLRGQTEHCLMAVRGKPIVVLTNQTTVIYGPLREHSRKPDEFYELVEALCPGSKVELFARESRPGWMVHGDQIELFL
jgi:ParB/RepB/Spo0J family partition protein